MENCTSSNLIRSRTFFKVLLEVGVAFLQLAPFFPKFKGVRKALIEKFIFGRVLDILLVEVVDFCEDLLVVQEGIIKGRNESFSIAQKKLEQAFPILIHLIAIV